MSAEKLANQLARNEVPDTQGPVYIPGAHPSASEEGVRSPVWPVLEEWPRCEARARVIDPGIAVVISGKEVLFVIAESDANDAHRAGLMTRELFHKLPPGLNVPKADSGVFAGRVEPLTVLGEARTPDGIRVFHQRSSFLDRDEVPDAHS